MNSIYKVVFTAVLFLFCHSAVLFSQIKKVLIIPLEEDTLVNCHVGMTIFSNSFEPLHSDLDLSKIVEDKLVQYLDTSSFFVKIIPVPDELRKNAIGFWGKSKEYKAWLSDVEKGYDILFIVNNIDISNLLSNVPKGTSGFYSKGRLHGVYTTISFEASLISNNRNLEYYNMGSKVFVQMKDFQMPEDKRSFDPEMLNRINQALIEQMDARIRYFLAKTYILPNLNYK